MRPTAPQKDERSPGKKKDNSSYNSYTTDGPDYAYLLTTLNRS